MARDTRQRILDTSLEMFNALGEPNVTTNHIADELQISPGNLYYHFRNKDDIIDKLFARFEANFDEALQVPGDREAQLRDIWMQLHQVFECMWNYRFIYRDLINILARNRKLARHFARILKRASERATAVLKGLVAAGIMRASADEVSAAAENILLVATFWQSFNTARSGNAEMNADDVTRGIHQVMMLIAPFLRDAERLHLNTLAGAYLR